MNHIRAEGNQFAATSDWELVRGRREEITTRANVVLLASKGLYLHERESRIRSGPWTTPNLRHVMHVSIIAYLLHDDIFRHRLTGLLMVV